MENNYISESELRKIFQLAKTDPKTFIKLYSELEGYKEPPVDIITFIEDNYFLGKSLKGKVFPIWKDALKRVFPNPFYSPYVEVSFTGAIGIGKTTIARIIIMYDLYRLLLLKDPHKKFNLIPTDRIVIALFNATLNLADQVLYEPFKNLISNSDFFTSMLDINNKKTSEIRFVNNIGIVVGSRFSHALGLAVFGGLLDEANFSDKVANQAYDSYTALLRRMQSRFLQKGGKVPGHLCLVSSKKSKNDFLEQHIEKSKDKPGIIVFDLPIWEVKKHLGIYSGKTFRVFVGDETKDPFIIESEDDLKYVDPSRVIDVPIEYKSEFEKDIYNALRDIAGISTGSTFRIFKSKEVLLRQATVVNPISQEIIRLDFYDEQDTIISRMNLDYLRNPLYNHRPRYIHIDLAVSQDRVGIAATYIKEYKTIERLDPVTMKKMIHKEPVTVTDFVIYIEAKPGQEIPFYKIKEFISNLININYPIAKITLDGFQSTDMKQQFRVHYKLNSDILSVDRIKDPYLSFRNAIMEGRAWIPNHPLLIKEFLNIEDTGKKIDHPREFPDGTRGSKDGADAVVGSYWSAITSEDHWRDVILSDNLERSLVSSSERNYITEQLFGDI